MQVIQQKVARFVQYGGAFGAAAHVWMILRNESAVTFANALGIGYCYMNLFYAKPSIEWKLSRVDWIDIL